MGDPKAKDLKSESTADKIFRCAIKLFLEKGYHGTSIDDIVKSVGITKGALYWHFNSKEGLLRKLIEDWERRSLDRLIYKLEEVKGGALDKLETLFRHNAAFAFYNRELCVSFSTLSAELIGAPHEIETEIRRLYEKYRGVVLKIVKEGQTEEIFRKDLDPDLFALTIMAFHDGVLFHWFMNKDEVDGKAFVNTSNKMILDGSIKQ